MKGRESRAGTRERAGVWGGVGACRSDTPVRAPVAPPRRSGVAGGRMWRVRGRVASVGACALSCAGVALRVVRVALRVSRCALRVARVCVSRLSVSPWYAFSAKPSLIAPELQLIAEDLRRAALCCTLETDRGNTASQQRSDTR